MIFADCDLFFTEPSADVRLKTADYVRRLDEQADGRADERDSYGRDTYDGRDTYERADGRDSQNRSIERVSTNRPVGIAGAGLMGRSIAAAFLRRGFSVLLYDVALGALAEAPERIAAELAAQMEYAGDVTQKSAPVEAAERVARLLTTSTELADLDGVDLILETIVEKLKVKKKFYQKLDAVCSAPKFLLSNTSTIRISELAEGVRGGKNISPENFCGFHFFHPVRKRSLVEVIRGPATSDAAVERAAQIAGRIDKKPIRVEDGPGFLVNRLLNPYLDEAMALLLEGVSLERIENVCRRFGMEMGPFRIMDEIGLDVTMHSGWTFYKAFPNLISSADLLPAMIDAGRLGRKNGLGFCRYDTFGNWADDASTDEALGELVHKASRFDSSRTLWIEGTREPLNGPNVTDEMIAARIFGGVLFEASRILADRIVRDSREADRALVFGLGFPKEKGGIVFWAKRFGPKAIQKISSLLEPLGAKYRLEGPLADWVNNRSADRSVF